MFPFPNEETDFNLPAHIDDIRVYLKEAEGKLCNGFCFSLLFLYQQRHCALLSMLPVTGYEHAIIVLSPPSAGVEEEVGGTKKSRCLQSSSLSPASSPITGRSGSKRRKN